MPPKRGTKASAGLTQPTLSFQTKLRSTGGAKAAAKSKQAPATVVSRSSDTPERVPAPSKKKEKAKAEKEETIDLSGLKDDARLTLNPNGKEWNGIYKEAKAEMGGMAPIHGEGESKVQSILRVFDMTAKYGPYVGITRLDRWERAKKWGLEPPEEIKQILLTEQGEDDPVYRESVVYGWV